MKHKKIFGYIVAVLIYFTIYNLPLEGLSEAGRHCLSVFGVAVFLWATQLFHLAITGLIVIFLLPITGVITSNETYQYFASSSVFFILGAFILASPIMRSGLSARIALKILSKFATSPKKLILVIFYLSTSMAFIISEHAVAALLIPIITSIIIKTNSQKSPYFAFAAYLAMAWGAIIGGTATLLGGARAPLAVGILKSTSNVTISFLEWMVYSLPIVFLSVFFGSFILLFIIRRTKLCFKDIKEEISREYSLLDKISLREKNVVFVMSVTIFLWIFFGSSFGLESVALFGVILSFAMKNTNWNEVQQDVNWGIILMYGSAITLGYTLQSTGASEYLVLVISQSRFSSAIYIFIFIMILAGILTELMSNAATVAVLLPMGLSIGLNYGIDPKAMAVGIATVAGLAFILPVSTPAIAMIIDTKYVNSSRAMFWGFVIKIITFSILLLTAFLYWLWLGLLFV